jgi:hypothetical protein
MADKIQRIAGGTGCDIVTSADGDFAPRKGKIYAIVVREDGTQIAHAVEYNNGTLTRVTSRSWIGLNVGGSSGGDSDEGIITLLKNDLLIPDFPLTEIEIFSGSVMVYYEEYGWKHFRR